MGRKLPKMLTKEEQKAFLETFNIRYQISHRNLCMVRLMLERGLGRNVKLT